MRRFKFLRIGMVCVFLLVFALLFIGAGESTKEKKVEFTMWLFNYDAKMMPDYQSYADEFMGQNPGVKITLEMPGFAEYFEMLQTRIHAGDPPDLMITRVGWFPSLEKFLEDWNKYLPKGYKDRFYEGPWEQCNIHGKQLGIPTAISTRGLVYRPDIFQELGLKVPKTWDDFYNALKVIKKGRPDISPWGVQCGNGDLDLAMAQFYHFMGSNDSKVIDENGKVVIGVSPYREKNIEALAFIRKCVDEGLTVPDPTAYAFGATMELYTAGATACLLNGPWMEFMSQDAGTPFACAPGPMKKRMAAVGFVNCISMYNGAENKEVLAEWLQYLYEDERRAQWSSNHGMIPSLKSVGQTEFYQQKTWKTFLEMLDYAVWHPNNNEHFNSIALDGVKQMQACILGEKTPAQAIDDWHKQALEY